MFVMSPLTGVLFHDQNGGGGVMFVTTIMRGVVMDADATIVVDLKLEGATRPVDGHAFVQVCFRMCAHRAR